ncbi:MAG: hypothetical protein HY010_09980 [Acidobacteria bacterium]|nr:hypothetical protein [Acidobacteriota bacterium]
MKVYLWLAVLLAMGWVSIPAEAQTWGGGTGVWSNAANWCGGIPNGGDAFIGNCKGGGTGVVTQDTGNAPVGNLTIDSGNSVSVAPGKRLTIAGATISNAGTLTLAGTGSQGAQMVWSGSTVTLKGGGTFAMSDAPNLVIGGSATTLINQETISGGGTMAAEGNFNMNNQGLVNANLTTPLQLRTTFGTLLNSGTLQASNGGTLRLVAGTGGLGFDNTGGTIQALNGSTVTLEGVAITGGTFSTSGNGVVLVKGLGGFNNLTNSGLIQVGGLTSNSALARLSGTINNTGTFQLGSAAWGDDNTLIDGTVILKGKGTIQYVNAVESIVSGSGTPFLDNVDNLIEGGGTLGNGIMALTNEKKGFILANLPAQFNLNLNPFNNQGKLQVNVGSVAVIPSKFSNFSGSTLTGGTYIVGGTLKFANANIVTNAANIQLTSPTALITASTTNALLGLSSNTKKGSLTIQGKAALTTNIAFTNAHNTSVKANSSFTVGGASTYTQTGGTTKVDGTLSATAGFALQGGSLLGKGKVAASVVSDSIVTAGDSTNASGKLSIIGGTGTYTQRATGTLNIQIGGIDVGGKYSQLAVANGASLAGTLNIKLIKNFLPAIGDTFTILTASARTGQFSTVNGLSINSGEHFEISYAPTSVQLAVVSGP